MPLLIRNQHHQRHHDDHGADDDCGGGPAQVHALDQHERERGEHEGKQHLPDGIEATRGRGLRLGKQHRSEHDRDDAKRHTGPEHRLPACGVDEQAAENRTCCERHRAEGGPPHHGHRALLHRWECGGEKGEPRGGD